MSALTRIAYDDHPSVEVERGDTVIISAKPVPGNELRVHDAINRLAKCGRRGAAPGDRAGPRLRARLLRGAADAALAAAAEGRDADPRRVPDARRARPARAGRGRPGRGDRDRRERLGGRADARPAHGSSTGSTPGVTFVDGLGVGDVQDVALRDRRRLSEDGVLIVVTTVGALGRRRDRAARADRARLRRGRRAARRAARARPTASSTTRSRRHHRDQAAAGAHARRDRAARLRPHAPPADDPPGGDRGLSDATGPDVIERHAASELTARRLTAQLRACEAAVARVLPAARALEPRRRRAGDAGRARRRRSGTRPTGSRRRSPGWRRRSRATCSSSSRSGPRAARGTAAPARGELVEWRPVLDRAGVHACPNRVAAVYLELAVLVRALAGPRRRGAARGARPTARRSGPASSTCATRCSARRSTTSARSPPSA